MHTVRPKPHHSLPTPTAAASQRNLKMAKNIAPLLSFGAGGQLAKTAVYASWKGIPYTRRYVIPANPRTTKQVIVRDLFKTLQQMWLIMPSLGKAPFDLNAAGRPYTPANKFSSLNIKGVSTAAPLTTMDFFQGSPGAKGGLPPASLIVTPGSGTLTAAIGAPSLPPDWTITQAVGVAFLDQAPDGAFEGQIQAQFDASAPYSLAFSGLTASSLYVVSAWFEWTRPDGTPAYSTSLTTTATPS